MKYKFAISFLILSCAPVQAHCHKYSRWYYPYPQRCMSLRYNAEIYKPKLEVKFVDTQDMSTPLAGTFGALHFNNVEDFPKIEIPTDIACPYQDDRKKALCMIKIEVDKKNGK
jgi:hypothetical protein